MVVAHTDPTRNKILEAAGEIFAEQGFQAATVRDICARAGSNLASVNYHFGDKAGLYIEVLRAATGNVHAETLTPSETPEETLRHLIFAMCRRMLASDRPSWALRLMAHEMSRPSEALDRVVEEIIRPSYLHLCETLGEILELPPGDRITRLCAHSVISQIVHYKNNQPVIARLWPDLKMTDADVEEISGHIFEFSICAVRDIVRNLHKQNGH